MFVAGVLALTLIAAGGGGAMVYKTNKAVKPKPAPAYYWHR